MFLHLSIFNAFYVIDFEKKKKTEVTHHHSIFSIKKKTLIRFFFVLFFKKIKIQRTSLIPSDMIIQTFTNTTLTSIDIYTHSKFPALPFSYGAAKEILFFNL